MMATTYIDALLAELARSLGLSTLALDDRGSCAFAVDDGAIRVDLQVRPRLGVVDLTVRPDGIELSKARVDALLAANFCRHGTDGAVFALAPLSSSLVLQRRCFENELAHGGLSKLVERLVRFAQGLPRYLASIEDATGAARRVPEPTGGQRA
jgi:hypothetical protein